VSDGEYVCGRWTIDREQHGNHGSVGLPPTGRPVTMTGEEVFRAEGGQFVEVWHQEDLPTKLAELGLQPLPLPVRLAAWQSAWRYRRSQHHA
jgi:predicted ester cyclase